MYKVYLCDDEKWVLEELKILINWNDYGFELIGDTNNPLVVIDEIQRLKPDLVFLDIQMNKMTGIELAEKIKKISNNTVIYFLTAFDTFNYAIQAIELGVRAYFTKPINKEELIDRLIKLNRELTNEMLVQIARQCLFHNSTEKISNSKLIIDEKIKFCEEDRLFYVLDIAQDQLVNKYDFVFPVNEGFLVKSNLKDITNFHLESKSISNIEEFILQLKTMINRIDNLMEGMIESTCLNQEVTNQILKDIHENYSQKIQLSTYSEKYNYTVSYLSLLFKQIVGTTFIDYLLKYRLNIAQQLIIENKLSMKEIAISVGYTDYYQFSKIFKKKLKRSPNEFKKEVI